MTELRRNVWLATPMMRGADVVAIQARLAQLGYRIGQDGLFGRESANAIKEFQQSRSLTVDGIVGVQTWEFLFNQVNGSPIIPDNTASDILDSHKLGRLGEPHTHFGGVKWSLTKRGVLLEGETTPTTGEAHIARVRTVLAKHRQPIFTVLSTGQVPIELLLACICTESGGDANAKRYEPGCDRTNPERTPNRVSFGLMQTLLGTARDALSRRDLRLDALLDPETSISAGAAYMWRQARQTYFDPPLVAAAYNAGGLYFNSSKSNRWRLRQYPIGTSAHCDRFIQYFNAAMSEKIENFPSAIYSFKVKL